MGSYQSHASADKDLPTSSYHESVLEDAQECFPDTTTTDLVNDDEEYYSAEEGDSICSLTPERTRPESSSAGDSSETSDEDVSVDSCSQNESDEESSYLSEEEFLAPAETLANSINFETDVISQEDYSQCTSQEQDSIKLHMEKADKLNEICVSSEDKTGLNQDTSVNCISSNNSQDHRELIENFSNSSSFIPKQLPLDDAASDSNEYVLGSKGDVFQPSESHNEKSVLLTNRMSTINCHKRKRMEYLTSSESENDDIENTRSRKSNKQRKMSPKKRNRSRQIRYSRNRRKNVSHERK